MSIKSTIDCPDCGSPIYFESTLLISGQSFTCSNSNCGTSISLSSEETNVVANAFEKFEKIKHDALKQT
ncbi:hypothetical protein Marme_2658 [Marinomonas mediterranea MMB-1]|jgi:hypothetical protein|uniref:Uncharacterized protein n=1 Tax=Marinomonas mediterranea (strain ATCC 700492 / JCM 21426 / NBRC 103028 / MMB-1) TaxID=717774 RepID=F2JXI9_MARM1|nr:hypothetical protein Marme_2658 [Marinomonas mediterranea MMB-1]